MLLPKFFIGVGSELVVTEQITDGVEFGDVYGTVTTGGVSGTGSVKTGGVYGTGSVTLRKWRCD